MSTPTGFQDTHIPGSSKGKQAPRHDPEIIWTLGPRYDTKPIQRTSPASSGIWSLSLIPPSCRSDRRTGKSTAPSYKDDPRIEGPPIPWTLENTSLLWRHNERDSVSNHRRLYCLLKRLFRRRSKVTSKLRVTGLCAWNSPGTGEFPA